MIKVHCFCDRCGKKLNESERRGRYFRLIERTGAGSPFYWDLKDYKDFCKACSDELTAWLEKGAVKQ